MAKDTISYWDGNGKYNSDYTKLWESLVPDSGEAETIEGELIRAIGRLFHEYCNNGNCNAVEQIQEICPECEDYEDEDDDCLECGGDCSVLVGLELSGFYKGFLFLIKEKVGCNREVKAVENLITNVDLNYNYTYNQKEMDVYNALCDKVIEYVLEKEKTGFTKLNVTLH